MNSSRDTRPPSLLLNAVPFEFDCQATLRVGHLPYEGREALDKLRNQLRGTCVVRRHRNQVEVVAITPDADLPGKVEDIVSGNVTGLVTALLSEWLIEHFTGLGRRVYRRKGALVVVSEKAEDELLRQVLPRGVSAPSWLGLRTAYQLNVRVERLHRGHSDVLLTIDTFARPCIDASVVELLALGIPVEGFYLRRSGADEDPRLADGGRLTGRVARVAEDKLELADHDEGWPTITADQATLEPRMEVLAHVVASICGNPAGTRSTLEQLRTAAGGIAIGNERLGRVRSLTTYLRRQTAMLAPELPGKFGELIASNRGFPPHEVVTKPALIFDPRGSRTNRWNQGGLDQHGPFDRYQFNPKSLNIAVICRVDLQGRVEQFVEQLLHGIPGTKGGDVGFLRRFALEKPYVHVFTAQDATAGSYRQAAINAIEHITDLGKSWNLGLVQTEEAMEALYGDDNPYLVSKAFFLSKGVAVQHVQFETMDQQAQQRAWSLNNIGLACYAKLGGVPWLLPSDQTVTHELVIGLGSHHERTSRFGSSDRYVGITTVFSGDGRYLLESRTRAVPFRDYGAAMLDAVRAAVGHVRKEFAWAPGDPVRLVFHVFKPIKGTEAKAVQTLMTELALPHAEYAFLHIADAHPYQVFNEIEPGARAGRGTLKGVCAPPRGLLAKLSNHDALLCLKGARELKQHIDGHPGPLLLHLHRESSFRDLTYLGRQAFSFSCHSWRSFLPAPTPITILYSQLVARNLRQLSNVTGWSDDAIIGRIGRTRWFL